MAIPAPRWFIQSWLHQLVRDFVLRMTWREAIDGFFFVVATVSTVLLTILTLADQYKMLGWFILTLLIALVMVRGVAALCATGGEDGLKRRIIWRCLHLLHKDVFHDSRAFRLTFFVRDPVALTRCKDSEDKGYWDDVLVPLVRRESGQPVFASFRSKAYFPRTSNAVTAIGWNEAIEARRKLREDWTAFVWRLPAGYQRFTIKDDLVHFYKKNLHIQAHVVSRISDYMVGVVQIFSFPFVDDAGTPMGLLSIDSTEFFGPAQQPGSTADGDPIGIDSVDLAAYLEAIRCMLVSLGYATGRT